MMRQRFFPFSGLLLLIMSCTTARHAAQVQEPSVSIKPTTATLDKFGYLYYGNTQQEIYKIDKDGNEQGYYSNNRLGNVSIIDVTNPLKILVYFQDFFTGIFLDRQLNETSRFNMIDLGYGQIEVVGSSLDGALWIFDDHAQRLNKVDQQGGVLQRGQDLRLLFNERLRPIKIVEANGMLHLLVPNRGLLLFDLFGQYQTQVLLPDLRDFQILDNLMVYTTDDQLFKYSFQTHLSTLVWETTIQNGEKMLWSGGDQISLVSKEGIKKLQLTAKN
ncbi:MAG: hypothetical protein HKN87_10975 [Saprospiraceae bacterium]|nr:hypothetical protein [Saprospiraceae bacterium]